MANRFEGFQGMYRRFRTHEAQAQREGGMMIYSRGYMSPSVTIDGVYGQKSLKVKTDGKGGFVVRPSRWARQETTAVNIYALNGAHVWVSSKVRIHNPEARSRAQLSVRTFRNEGLADSAATLRVRGSAPRIEVKDRATAIVGWHTQKANLYNPTTFQTRTADVIRSFYYGDTDKNTEITVRRGQVGKLDVSGNVNARVKQVTTIVTEGENNNIITNGYNTIIKHGSSVPDIRTPRGRQLYPRS